MTHPDTILSLSFPSVGLCLFRLHCLALILVIISSHTVAEAFETWSAPRTQVRIND